ncbi:hypothetical protein PCASD_25325 [Puccinia coronata f. sp. avenae]|uniref:Uncharacterized protein n=1 Tax=Puccinia coronata f. sp. avenae TaxID=200324 RepID=A0A2N5S0E3_9BASI|nr:hypothetical protein PCASD_25325 [Puccinia coronata f. sp. avenae]
MTYLYAEQSVRVLLSLLDVSIHLDSSVSIGIRIASACGKIDAGIAVLIGSHAHLIEFPSLLLPPGCETGSIVSITCTRDHAAEKAQADSFWDLQTKIVDQFGMESPQPPNLRLRSITQTSVTLEWDKLQLAQCLDLDSEYTFHLAMKTTGGSFNSQQVKVKTHSLNDTSGINVLLWGHLTSGT